MKGILQFLAIIALEILHFLAIVVLCILFAVTYGIVHDQITARVCVEYFTIGHPPVFNTEDPTLLGLGWGIIATWWVGLGLGVPLALAARLGWRNQRRAVSLLLPLEVLMGTAGVCALVAGVLGYFLALSGAVLLIEPLASRVPADRHVPFLADMWAHSASYLVGFFGGLAVIGRVIWTRFRVSQ